jgi:hypothetical protein
MSNTLFCHGYTTKYVIINGIKKLKKLIYTTNCMGNCNISQIGDIWFKSDFRLICDYFFVRETMLNQKMRFFPLEAICFNRTKIKYFAGLKKCASKGKFFFQKKKSFTLSEKMQFSE